MPELPEVETVRRDLDRVTQDETITWIKVHLARTIAYPDPDLFGYHLVGCRLVGWHRRGKYLLGVCHNGAHLGVHLRMTGQLLWVEPHIPLPKHTRVQLGFKSGMELRFVDQRTFGQLWAVAPHLPLESVISGLAQLGPEPFSEEFSDSYWISALQRQRPIKNALLDQTLVAGVGNIYADEALFLSQIHPQVACAALSPEQACSLRHYLIQVLQTSIDSRGTTFSAYRDAMGINGNYQGQAWVYGRKGSPCRICQTPIQRLKLAGRSAHFCPTCQPSPIPLSCTLDPGE